jgi:hypothetical protein
MPVRRTRRLRLEPIGPEHAGDLWRLHQDEAVAAWHGGRWTADEARRHAAAQAPGGPARPAARSSRHSSTARSRA